MLLASLHREIYRLVAWVIRLKTALSSLPDQVSSQVGYVVIKTLGDLMPGNSVCDYGIPGSPEDITRAFIDEWLQDWEAETESILQGDAVGIDIHFEEVRQASYGVVTCLNNAVRTLEELPPQVGEGLIQVWYSLWSYHGYANRVSCFVDEWIQEWMYRLA